MGKVRVCVGLEITDPTLSAADAAATVEESAAGSQEIEGLLASKAAAEVAEVVVAAAAASDASAPAKSGLKIGNVPLTPAPLFLFNPIAALKRRISD